jgi:predicted permease
MNFTVMIESVLMMASMLGIGGLLTKKVRVNEDTRTLLTNLIIYVSVPCVIIGSFIQLPKDNSLYTHLLLVFLFSFMLYLITLVVTWWIARGLGKSKRQASQMAVIAAQGNTGFIGLPLCLILFDSREVILAAIFDTAVGVSLWTLGVMVIRHRYSITLQSLKPMLNFPLIAFFIGIVLSFIHVNVPEPLLQLFLKLGALASPLALIYIGLFIPKLLQNRKNTDYPSLLIAIGIKLIGVPLLTISILFLLRLDSSMSQVILLLSTMPTGSMVPILFATLQTDEEFGAQATVYATLLSLITIPIMYSMGTWMLGL